MSKRQHTKKSLIYEYDKELVAAFKEDCEELLIEYEKLQSFSFSHFAEVWRNHNFTYVFSQHSYALLLKEFCENCFYNVKKYIVFPKSLYTQVGALYVLYGLYYKQPLKYWIKIRLIFDEYEKLLELVHEMKKRQQLDPVYVFTKLKVEEAFLYVALRKPLGPEDRFIKGYQPYYNDTFNFPKSNSSVAKFHNIMDSSALIELEKTDSEYQELMKKFAGKNPDLAQFPTTTVRDVRELYSKFLKGVPESTENKKTAISTRTLIKHGAIENKNAQFPTTIVGDVRESYSKFLEGGPEPEENKETSIISIRTSIKDRAIGNKNAVYRGAKKVKTALDDDMNKLLNTSNSNK